MAKRGKKRRLEDFDASSGDEQENWLEDDDSGPPAKKLLKSLLIHKVSKAIKDLSEEIPSQLRAKGLRASFLISKFDLESEECTVTAWLKKSNS